MDSTIGTDLYRRELTRMPRVPEVPAYFSYPHIPNCASETRYPG